ncbi:MAG: hypothetical protein GC201_13950 [Alphaproteobacteria bacterium]|nr:hypothetical protein [Alphaproteobacteria bacterium]
MRRFWTALAGAALLGSAAARAQTDQFDTDSVPPVGYGAHGELIQMCNEAHLLAAKQTCETKIRYYEDTMRDFDRRKARGNTDATARQLQWLRGLQHDLTEYRKACDAIDDGLRDLRAHPETRCDSVNEKYR